jgi:gamma-glutamyl phosphate reductase
MGLIKQINTMYGISANYFIIAGVNVNTILRTAEIKLNGYYEQQADYSTSRALVTYTYKVSAYDFDNYFHPSILDVDGVDMYQMAIKYVLEHDSKFAGATQDE